MAGRVYLRREIYQISLGKVSKEADWEWMVSNEGCSDMIIPSSSPTVVFIQLLCEFSVSSSTDLQSILLARTTVSSVKEG